MDVPEGIPCSIANPRADTEGQIGIVGITRRTTRQNYVNMCSSFQLIGVAQREKALQAVILIRNDSKLNNDYESGNFLAGTTYAIFTEQQAFDGIIQLYGGEQNIVQMSAKILVAPAEGMTILINLADLELGIIISFCPLIRRTRSTEYLKGNSVTGL